MTSLRLNLTYRIARRLSQVGGFQVTYPRFIYRDELRALNAEWQQQTGSRETLTDAHWHLYSLAKSVANLPGDTVECGVNTGRGSWAIIQGTNRSRLHYCFDSWEGLSAPDAVDGNGWRAGDLATPGMIARHNLENTPAVFFQGWIPSRFHEVADDQFSLVHIDVDLYQPTLDSLEFFYPRTVAGGVIVCDDYGATISPGSKVAFDEFVADKPECSVVHLTTGQGLIWKRA